MIRLLGFELALAAVATFIVAQIFPHSASSVRSSTRALLGDTRRAWLADTFLHRSALAAIVVFGILIRIEHLDQPMRYDEAWMVVNYASRPLRVALSDYSLPNNHIFHTALVWFTTRVFGASPWAVRLPTLIAGVLLIPASYVMARLLGGRDAGLFAAALTAAMPSLILYSTNARGYVIICLAFLVLLMLANRLATEDSPGNWVAFAAVVALGAYTAPVMIYPAGVAGLWILAERARQRGRHGVVALTPKVIAAVALAGVLTLMAYGPVIVVSGTAPLVSNRFVTALTWEQFVAMLPAFVGTLRDTLALGIPAALGAILVLAGIIAVAAPGPERGRRITLTGAAAIWCLLVLVATRRPPPARVWLFLVPLGCVFSGIGVATLIRMLATSLRIAAFPLATACSLLLGAAIGTHALRQRVVFESTETDLYGLRGAEQIAQYSLAELRRGDQLVAVGLTTAPLEYYFVSLAGRRLGDFAAATRSGRILVVVNDRQRQTLESVKIRRRDLPWDAFTSPVLVRKFTEASVYELHWRGIRG